MAARPSAPDTEPVLYLPPGWVSAATAQGVAVFAQAAAAQIEGEAAPRAMAVLEPLLDGRRSEAQVVAAARETLGDDAGPLIQALQAAGVVCGARDADAVTALMGERRRRLCDARITLAGAAGLADACAEALTAQGAGSVRCGPVEGLALLARVEGPRGFALACALDHGEIVIGPLTRVGAAGCWRCADLRRQANAPFALDGDAADAEADPQLAARLLAKALGDALAGEGAAGSLAGHVLTFEAGTLAMTRRRLLPVPGCEVCGGPPPVAAQRAPGGVAAPGSEGETLLALAGLVDARVGVINCVVMESPAALGLARPLVATAVTACAPDGRAPPARMPVGWGKGMTPEAAAVGACGEALERYAASLPDPRRIRHARLADLPAGEAVDPRDFPLYAPDQYERPGFPFVPFDPAIPHPWVAGWRAIDGAPAWLPAAFCFLTPTLSRRQNFCAGTSNGLAAGVGTEDAALRAMLELLERDAVMAAWRTGSGGQAVAIDAAWDGDLLEVIGGIEALGGAVEARLLGSACGYPAAMCLAFGDGAAWPGVTLGLGVDPDPRAALRQAVMELGQTGPYLRRLMREGAAVPAGPQAVREMMDHAAYYFDPRRAKAFDRLRGGPEMSWADLPAGPERSLAGCVAALEAAGVRMWLADVTSADLALTPFRVVRAVSPDLQPISFGFGLDRVSVARIAAAETRRGQAEVAPIW